MKMSKKFNNQPDELFGRYCLIEQKRYGVVNEKFLYKVINTLNSNVWSDVPVDNCDKEIKLHDHCEQVVNVICCGVSEDKVERYRLCDIELLPNKLQTQLDQQKAMWNELRSFLDEDKLFEYFAESSVDGYKNCLLSIKNKMQELEKGEKDD